MKIICKLPDPKFYRPIAPSDAWYKWEDKSTSKIKLLCKSADPWRFQEVAVMFQLALSKGDKSEYPTALNLKIYPNPEPGIRRGQIIREHFKGSFANSMTENIFFAAFPIPTEDRIQLWISYTFVGESESVEGAIDRHIKNFNDPQQAIKQLQEYLEKLQSKSS